MSKTRPFDDHDLHSLVYIIMLSYHIWFLGENTILQTLWSQPPDWKLDICKLILTKVLLCPSAFRKAKVSNFNDKIHINPIFEHVWLDMGFNQLAKCVKWLTHMQFLAAKSLCTTFMTVRYSIPLAICKHMSINCFSTSFTCIKVIEHT